MLECGVTPVGYQWSMHQARETAVLGINQGYNSRRSCDLIGQAGQARGRGSLTPALSLFACGVLPGVTAIHVTSADGSVWMERGLPSVAKAFPIWKCREQ